MKKISLILLLGCAVMGNNLFAQNVDQGRKFLYNERYQSAKDQFDKLLATNPNNIDAVYWLGQTLIEMKDSVAAKALYQKALSTNGNAPLLLAGMGQIELMDNKTNDARQRFETAISLSKNKDVNVLNAIARANTMAHYGDANYALEKLNALGTQKKDIRNAESYLLIGDAHRKLIDGGGAVTAYQKALSMDPKMAAAKHRIGRVYLTQNNPEYFLPAFQEAVQLDPNYAPGIYELYYYWFERDINKAKEYFDKYLSVADAKPSNEYDRTSIIYASRDFQGAVTAANAKITELGEKADPRYYKLVAYSYDELKDSVNAKTFLDQYFAKQKKEGFIPKDYVFRANLLSKFPGNEAEALQSYQTAVEMDTAKEGKLKLMGEAAAFANKSGNRVEEANWLGKVFEMKGEAATNRDLYDWGFANYQAANYATADSIFCNMYTTKYPNELYGYLWCARAKAAQDTTQELGIAVEPYKKLIAFADTAQDKEKIKGTLVSAHGYLASYYANVAKNKDSAIASLQSILDIDPENASAKQYIEVLKKPAAAAKSSATTPKSRAKTTKPAATKKKPKAA
ncbi:MAG: tetratricopeptide repeat protein [Chitinophagaceae bacterium]